MFDYARNLRLALNERLRSGGLMAGAAVVLLIGAGFLLAALWTWLASHLRWGPLGASAAMGGGLVLVGLVLLALARRKRHAMPTTDDLRAEVEARLGLAADAVVGKAADAADAALHRAQKKATNLMGQAQNRAQTMADQVLFRADRFADRTEARAQDATRRAKKAAGRLGVTEERVKRARNSNVAALAPLIGAFAVGITLASRLRRPRDDGGESGPSDQD